MVQNFDVDFFSPACAGINWTCATESSVLPKLAALVEPIVTTRYNKSYAMTMCLPLLTAFIFAVKHKTFGTDKDH